MNNAIPRAQSPLVDRAGHPTREWYSFFLSALEAADGDSSLEEQIRTILARLAALEGSSPLNFQLLGLDSVVVSGTPQNGYVQINLDGDTGEPGGTYFYGTGPDGAKGWQLLGDAFVAETGELTKEVEPDTGVITLGLADVPDSGTGTLQAITVDGKGRVTGAKDATITGTAGQIAVANGNASSGLPTISLVDVPDAGGGTLQKTQFDAKGRKTGTSAATTDNLPEGSANLYFTTGRAAAAAPVQSVTGVGSISVTGTGGNRVVSYQHAWTSIAVTRNSPSRQLITAAAFATVIYNTVVFDRLSEFNTTTGAATVTSAGLYLITAAVHGGPPADGANFAVSIFINGVERARLAEQLASNPTSTQPGAACGGAAQMNLSAGDVITIRMYVGATTSPSTLGVTANFPAGTHLEITRIA